MRLREVGADRKIPAKIQGARLYKYGWFWDCLYRYGKTGGEGMDANARFFWVQYEEESMAHCKLQGWRERDTAGLGECQALFSHKK